MDPGSLHELKKEEEERRKEEYGRRKKKGRRRMAKQLESLGQMTGEESTAQTGRGADRECYEYI